MERVKYFSSTCDLCSRDGGFLLDNKCKRCLGIEEPPEETKTEAESALGKLLSYVKGKVEETETRIGATIIKSSKMKRETTDVNSCKNKAHLDLVKYTYEMIEKSKER